MKMRLPSDRQAAILDTPLMKETHVTYVGVGRAIGSVEIMASAGLGRLTVIDPDTVSSENVGQSGHTLQDVGRPKVTVARDRSKSINPDIFVREFACVAGHVPDLAGNFFMADLIKIGIDDPAVQFRLADLAQSVGTSAIVCGTTGDNFQWFVAHIAPNGPRLRDLLPEAWRGLQEGYTAPAFFPSCRLHAESLNVQASRLALGLIHFQAGSSLKIAEIGAAFTENPLVIGSNHWHQPSNFLTPACFLSGSPA